MSNCTIIAEAGVNHNGSLTRAKELAQAAKEAGADIVKFQTFNPHLIATARAGMAPYQRKAAQGSQRDMLYRLAFSEKQFAELMAYCHSIGIRFLSTPFDTGSADMLARLGVNAYKVSSGDLTNAPLLLHLAARRKPILLSTGMADRYEILQALSVLAFGYTRKGKPSMRAFTSAYAAPAARKELRKKITLLHCVSSYPVPAAQANLSRIAQLRSSFGLATGYSDHTLGIAAPIAAIALGAQVIEKHLTLDKRLPGPDHAMSLSPDEMKAMVAAIRETEKMIHPHKSEVMACERENMQFVRKSLVALGPVGKGELLTSSMIGAKRPGNGLSPLRYWTMLGTRARKNYQEDDLL